MDADKTLSYKTLSQPVSAELTEKKSLFIASAAPVGTVEEGIAFVRETAKKNPDASHNVYAYIVGETFKFSDDGEPSMTAGAPVYNALKGLGFTNTAIVVTRYFGGTMLGKGGLIRAYSAAAKLALEKAAAESLVVEKTLYEVYELSVPYQLSGKLEHLLSVNSIMIISKEYGPSVVYEIAAAKDKAATFEEMATALRYSGDGGEMRVKPLGEEYL